MFAKWENGLMLVSDGPKDGYKPMQTTEPPEAPSGYVAAFYWRETGNAWEQTWEIVKDSDDDLDDAELLSILLGGDGE